VTGTRFLLACVAEDRPEFHRRVEMLVGSARELGGSLAASPIVVNMVASADPSFVERVRELDAEVRIVPPCDVSGQRHANKLRMLEDYGEDFDILLALDCDVAIAGDVSQHVDGDAINVVPADIDPLTDRQWRALLAGLGLDAGARSARATATGRAMYPYFNSGVLAVPCGLRAELLAAWRTALADVAQLWQHSPRTMPSAKRFYADQYALMAALRRGLPWIAASPALNFATHVPLHGPTVAKLSPAVLHYHAELDERGFLLRPRCPVAQDAAERINRSHARSRGIPYSGMKTRPLGYDAYRVGRSAAAAIKRRCAIPS
jgi:hypothetical protein